MPNEMAFDFSLIPDAPKPMQFDFSGIPDKPKPERTPYAGEDQGSQLISYTPDSWINDEIPAAPAQPLFTPVPRPPERLYRENAPQILQDTWNAASPEPTVGPLREHPLRPDVRKPLWTLFKEQALPSEPTGILENLEAGLRQASAHVAANVISLIGFPTDESGGPTRAEQYNSIYKLIYKTILPDNVAPPQDFLDSLARGVGEAAPNLVETMLLSYATGGVLNPAFTGMAEKFPTFVAKLFPIARDALTFGAQGALEPEQPGRQAAIGTGVGAILGTLSPYSRLARVIGGAGIGAAQEYLTDPNATAQDYARSATLMGAFAGLAVAHGLTVEETIAGTLFGWAKEKGYTPEQLNRSLQVQGIRPVLNEFAEDVTRGSASVQKPGIVVAENIPALYDLALSSKTNQKIEIRYKTVESDEAARLFEVTGNNLEGYIHSIDNYAIRHIIKEHGDPVTEAARGQIPITKDDISKIPEIVDSPDQVRALKTKQGREGIGYLKRVDGQVFYVEEIRTGKNQLAAVSMRKYQVGAPRATPEGGVAQPSETFPDSDLENIPPEVDLGNTGAEQTSRGEYTTRAS
ncbi:MAG: hypothetical protein ABSF52_06270 [Syntrophobacteraceae bacterium]|jgi:hypothetical protein